MPVTASMTLSAKVSDCLVAVLWCSQEHATCCVNSGPAFLVSSGMDPLAKVQLVESLVQVLDRTGLLAPTEVCTQLLS